MTTSSRNAAVRNMIEMDGDEETKEFVKNSYGLPSHLTTWKDIDDAAEKAQAELNKQWKSK